MIVHNKIYEMFKPIFNLNQKINWDELSKNQNAIHILEENLDKINWNWLSLNPNAIRLLEENLDKVNG